MPGIAWTNSRAVTCRSEASLTQSYQALDEPARRAFRPLALLDSAEITEWQVAALLGTPDAADVVNQLADSSLLGATGMDEATSPDTDAMTHCATTPLSDSAGSRSQLVTSDRMPGG